MTSPPTKPAKKRRPQTRFDKTGSSHRMTKGKLLPQKAGPSGSQATSNTTSGDQIAFEEQGWDKAFQNTVFSQYCPPNSRIGGVRQPTLFVQCDFDKSLIFFISTKNLDFNRTSKELFDGADCEKKLNDFLSQEKVPPPVVGIDNSF
jgi:hypothetical protein